MRHPRTSLSAATAALALAASAGLANPFTPGNIVALRIGDGNAALSTAATPLFLVEIDPANGSVVQTIPVPSTASGSTPALCTRGTSTSVGHLSRSLDLRYLTLIGVNLDAGLPGIQASQSAVNARVIARVDAQGAIDLSTALTDAYNGDDPRLAISTNGTDLWTAGTGNPTSTAGVRYTTLGSTTSVQLSTTPTNTRVVNIFNDQLYVTTMSGAFRGVCTVGAGVPTTSGQATTLLAGFDPASASPESAYDFSFADANTLYVADDRTATAGGGIQKWTFDGTTWTLAYTLNSGLTVGCRGLTARTKGGTTTLFATTGEATTTTSRVVMVEDAGASSAFTILTTSPANTQYRGIDFSPEAGGPAPCYPDCNADHALNVNDFICFQAAFAAGSPSADCNHDTALNVNDFICFQGAFAAGCSSL